ncbi:MAG: electron transfer flavoprotein subunit beta/FixA family protein [Kiritimatiellae bacterium]|nr:electron transfer flavoprotein subunit beta/FixA family protein [Kiritimatiellia bacterium]
MHVIVCIKQVPDSTKISIDPVTKTLMREGVESILNPFDEYALEVALRIKDEKGARVTVVSMGPPQATAIIREALARGADDGVLLSDRAFAGADTLATAYALTTAIQKINPRPDLVLFGKQAIDGDTAQVGPGVSEDLGFPLVTYVRDLKIADDGTYTVETVMDAGIDVLEGKLPAVMTVVKEAAVPRFATLAGWVRAKRAPVTVWTAKDTGADPARLGLNGSPTKVVDTFPPPVKTGGRVVDASKDPAAGVAAIVALMKEKKLGVA